MKSLSKDAVNNSMAFATISFGITLFRFLIALFAGVSVLYKQENYQALTSLSILLIVIFDYYDGVFFDKSNLSKQKEWRIRRRILDSVADRVIIQIICFSLLIADGTFLWPYLAILSRELILSSYLVRLFKRNILVYPKFIAKLACGTVALCVLAYLTTPSLSTVFIGSMLLMSFFSLQEYRDTFKSHERKRASALPEFREIEEV